MTSGQANADLARLRDRKYVPDAVALREAIAGGRCVAQVPGDPFRPLCLQKGVAVDAARGGPVCRKHADGSRLLRKQLRADLVKLEQSVPELEDLELGELTAFLKKWSTRSRPTP